MKIAAAVNTMATMKSVGTLEEGLTEEIGAQSEYASSFAS